MVVPPIKTEKGLAFLALMKNSKGECCFYDNTNKKCLIYTLRPIFCNSFPFTFTDEESFEVEYTEKAKKYCPGIDKNSPLVDLLELKELAGKTLKEIKNNHFFIEQWNNEVINGRISPSAKNFLNNIFNIKDV
jgi:Fe-S-cluster containining protein